MSGRWRFQWLLPVLAGLVLALPTLATGAGDAESGNTPPIWDMRLEGAIGPATAEYFLDTLEAAEAADAGLLLVRLDTPGGLDRAMRDMIKGILASRVPVAIYVYPQGARAASAGTYLLYAAHIAAMAPATNLGAATPVQIGGGSSPMPGAPEQPAGDKQSQQPQGKSAMERKQVNDAVAYIRGLAELRGRNAEWAENAVREAASLSAEKALEKGVIDLLAESPEALLDKLDGRVVEMEEGKVTLATAGGVTRTIEPDWRHRLLSVITNPSVAYILMLVGIYGLIFEFYNPGLGIPGVLGAICLLTGLYALQLLPVNYAGLALILLGLGLMVAEAMVPSFGIMGIGGLVAFVVGSVLLMDTDLPAFRIAWPLIGGLATGSVLILTLALRMALRSRHQAIVSGQEGLLASEAVALEDFDHQGRVHVQGEIWRAVTDQPVKRQQRLRVTAVDGLTLHVEARK